MNSWNQRPGRRVGVTLPMKGDEESLAMPRSALIRDARGDTGIHETIAPHVDTRRRVFVASRRASPRRAHRRDEPGAKVASQAAAELYGAEFAGHK